MTGASTAAVAASLWAALDGDAAALGRLSFTGDGALPSAFRVTDLAAAAIGIAALSAATLAATADAAGTIPAVTVDRRLAASWFHWSLHPQGWQVPGPWDPIAGDYPARDGWIRLHTNAERHRAAALAVLGTAAERDAVAAAVAGWDATALETAIVDAGGCAAEMRSVADWAAHPQGASVARENLVAWHDAAEAGTGGWRPRADRPLAGLRVLDLTRILAGPAACRFLAGYGADVLRIDPPGWDEPSVNPEMTVGKRCARLDLHDAADRRRFEALLAGADVLVHGYRADALAALGYDEAALRRLSPGLIDVALCAYGWTGPWAARRGFDSLVQMSGGIAEAGRRWTSAARPTPLPVQALDHATGYLMAAAAMRGLARRLATGRGGSARLSLARTSAFLVALGAAEEAPAFAAQSEDDLAPAIENTGWGPARRLRPAAAIEGAALRWDRPAGPLGSAEAAWA